MSLRYALRRMTHNPMAKAVAILSLALGIGVNTAVFSLIDGMFLRPLPVRWPGRLAWVEHHDLEGQSTHFSFLDYRGLEGEKSAFSTLVAESRRGAMLRVGGLSELVLLSVVSDNYFRALGVDMALGRGFDPSLDAASGEPAVIISHSLWIRHFGRDPTIVGKAIRLNQGTYTVAGVVSGTFRGTRRHVTNDVWVPVTTWLAMSPGNRPEIEQRATRVFLVMGHLRPGITLERAQAELDVLAMRFRSDHPDLHKNTRFLAVSEDQKRRRDAWSMSVLLLPIIGTVLLIACSNVVSLLLAEGLWRGREVALKTALGAGRPQLIRQFFVEGALLSALGSAAGLGIALLLLRAVPALTPPGPVPLTFDLFLDHRVMAVTLLLGALSAVLVGLIPAIRGSRVELLSQLRGERGHAAGGRSRLQKTLVVGQAALSIIMISAAILLVRSFLHSQGSPAGFLTDQPMVIAWVANDPGSAESTFQPDGIRAQLGSLPGVRRVSYARRVHLSGSGGGATLTVSPPLETGLAPQEIRVKYNQVAPGYFETVGTRVLQGRGFDTFDGPGNPLVILVSESAAHRFWPDKNPIGQRLDVDGRLREVVGISEDSRVNDLHEAPEPYLYLPFAQHPSAELTFLIQTGQAAPDVLPLVRETLLSQAPRLTLIGIRTLEDLMDEALYGDRLPALIASCLGLLGLFLVVEGFYAFMAQSVNRRRREIGIRMALGASGRAVRRQILRDGLTLGLWGLPLGLAGSWGVSRLLAGFLYGVSPGDIVSLAAGAAFTLSIIILACFQTARHASQLDPLEALRYE